MLNEISGSTSHDLKMKEYHATGRVEWHNIIANVKMQIQWNPILEGMSQSVLFSYFEGIKIIV